MSRVATGSAAEQTALDFLLEQGLDLVARNFKCDVGEIDLIMRDDEGLIFVEVKYRSDDDFADVLEQIRPQQCQRIRRAAQFFLLQQQLDEATTAMRFDVIALVANRIRPQWLIDAF
ncbi:YraN family protein [Pseudidiomarina taiwanensis]|uniref:UPF0102 protein CWI83_05840 n=1 Tax=Pseudidiomarina taiwanensis TaxID=337250 RepID=A0A432ZKV1_9GAMM|nr:YraN family protein [Pseudidiomarina taiwanensis]RUO78543.1 YraN family protein [Pseudidiomarina taiwanensis]